MIFSNRFFAVIHISVYIYHNMCNHKNQGFFVVIHIFSLYLFKNFFSRQVKYLQLNFFNTIENTELNNTHKIGLFTCAEQKTMLHLLLIIYDTCKKAGII